MSSSPMQQEKNFDALRNDLEILLGDIHDARGLLFAQSIPPKTASRLSFISTQSSKSLKTLKPPAITKNLFAKVSAPFRLVRSRSHRKKYDKMDETRPLVSDDRRGSADSDATLVNSIEGSTDSHVEDTAGQLLDVLAPLISALQKLTPRFKNIPIEEKLVQVHEQVCSKLVELLDDLTTHHQARDDSQDEHDLEMTSLMLDALRKKVEQERSVSLHRPSVATQEVEAEETMTEANCEAKHPSTGLPLLPVSKNPFILHSTSIALSPSRRSSSSTSIPIGDKAVPPPGTYSAYIGGAQQTWARNVIRIGSYQNSMLFSPSPVAVQPLASFGRL